MSRLKIKDMPPVEVVDGTEIIPTGGKGDVSVTVERIKNYVYAGANFTSLASQLQTVDLRSQNNKVAIDSHIADLLNPHQVTKAQVGLSNVDNTSDLNKPISTATQSALTTLDNTKANTTYVDAGLNTKANITYVDDNLALKEDNLVLGTTDLVAASSFDNVKDTNNLVIDANNQALLNRTEYLKTHNNLVGRDSTSAHPSSSIVDNSGKTQQEINDTILDISKYGAIGDGTLHTVQEWVTSGKYANITAIQVDYPHVTALTDSIDWAAVVKAVNIGSVHKVQSGTYVLNKGVDLTGGGFIGSGSGYSTAATTFKFVGGVTDVGAITTKIATARNRPKLQDLNVLAANWDVGLQCNGLDIESSAFIENVYVEKFYKNGLFLHNDVNGSGPYETYIRNVRSLYNRQHGAVVGTGANVVTLVNYEGKWNGSPSYGVAPTVAGNYDGLFISNSDDGNPSNSYYAYVPEGLTIIGGDCSYNSRYGWNIDTLKDSSTINPAYAEHNIVKQARIGNFTQCSVNFAVLSGGLAGLQNDLNYSTYYSTNRIFVAGRQLLLGGINYNYTALSGSTNRDYLSTSPSGSDITWIAKNQMPDSTLLADSGFATVSTLSGFGSYALALGSGSNFLKVSNNEIRIPLTYKRATAGGWNAASALRTMLSTVPTSGAYITGDYVEKINPTKDGNNFVKGWLRVTTGSNHVVGTDWIEDKVQLLDHRTATATGGAVTLAANAVRSFTVAFARTISINDHFSVTSRGDRQGTIIWAEYLDANTVTVYQYNPTTSSKTLASMVFEVRASI